jgi:hypothetical protein
MDRQTDKRHGEFPRLSPLESRRGTQCPRINTGHTSDAQGHKRDVASSSAVMTMRWMISSSAITQLQRDAGRASAKENAGHRLCGGLPAAASGGNIRRGVKRNLHARAVAAEAS